MKPYVRFHLAPPLIVGACVLLTSDKYLSSDDPRFPKLGERIVVTGIGASSSLDDEWN